MKVNKLISFARPPARREPGRGRCPRRPAGRLADRSSSAKVRRPPTGERPVARIVFPPLRPVPLNEGPGSGAPARCGGGISNSLEAIAAPRWEVGERRPAGRRKWPNRRSRQAERNNFPARQWCLFAPDFPAPAGGRRADESPTRRSFCLAAAAACWPKQYRKLPDLFGRPDRPMTGGRCAAD